MALRKLEQGEALEGKDAAGRLRELKDRIIEEHIAKARAELAAARTVDRQGLVDSLPKFLENLGDALCRGETSPNVRESARIGVAHGRVRAGQAGFSLHDLLSEYGILSDVVFGVLREGRGIGRVAEDIVRDAFHRGIANAAMEFARLRGNRDLKELSSSMSLLEAVIRNLPVGVSITEARGGGNLMHNAEMDRLVERPGAERRTLHELGRYGAIHEDGTSYAVDEYPTTRALTRGETVRDEPMRYRRRDGTVSTLMVSSTPIRDSQGQVEITVTTAYDVTEEVQAREQLRLMADSIPVHLLHFDRAGRVLFANQAAAATWGMPADRLVGRSIPEIAGEEAARGLARFTSEVFEGKTVSYESPFATPDGATRTFLNTYSPDRAPDGTVRGFVATGTDITERREAEKALERTIGELRQERVLRERFVATLSHDLRTPLTAARMSAQLLGRQGVGDAKDQRLVLRVIDNLDRADRMIRDLLDANRVRAGEPLPIEAGECDLTLLASETLDELATIHGERFALRAPAELVGSWSCAGVRRIIENLCNNAVKYGDPAGTVTVTLEMPGDLARVSVHNWGDPLPDADPEALFEPFHRSESASQGGQRGWGLGLTLVKGLAEAHGGRVGVRSAAESGTTFWVELPSARTA